MAARLLHLRNTSFASLLGDRRDLVGLIITYKASLAEDSPTGCQAAWCREELQSKRSQSCKRIISKYRSCFFCMKMKETEKSV